jgi:hypothetical protein
VGWTLTDLAAPEGYSGAVAVRQPNVAIRCQQAEWPWLLDAVREGVVTRP